MQDCLFYTLRVLNFACTKFRESQKILIPRILIFGRLTYFSISRVLNFTSVIIVQDFTCTKFRERVKFALYFMENLGQISDRKIFSTIFLKQNGFSFHLYGVFPFIYWPFYQTYYCIHHLPTGSMRVISMKLLMTLSVLAVAITTS